MTLEFDIRRSVILSQYLKCWGMPETRKIMSKGETHVELYSFPGEDSDQVSRFATVGLSSNKFSNSTTCDSELLLVLPHDVAHEQREEISHYLFDISSYLIDTLGRNVKAEDILPEMSVVPEGWPKAILFDEPRGEPENLTSFLIGEQHVNLHWVVPIFGVEYSLIKSEGIEAFDQAIDNIDLSLLDTGRDSCV